MGTDFRIHSLSSSSSKETTITNSSSSIPFSVTYGSSETASGVLGSDDITLSGLNFQSQIFGLVDSTNLTLGTQGISGVLGMGFPRGSSISRTLVNFTKEELNGSDSKPFLSNLLTNNNVSYPLFSLALNKTGGKLTLGALDSNILPNSSEVGQVEWSDVIPFPSGSTYNNTNSSDPTTSSLINLEGPELGDYVYWSLPLTGAGFNGSSIEISPTYNNTRIQVGENTAIALVDSGTVGIVGSFQDVANLYAQIPESRHVGEGVYYVPCSTNQRMYFQFNGGRNLTLEPEDYIIGPAAGNPYACISWPIAAGELKRDERLIEVSLLSVLTSLVSLFLSWNSRWCRLDLWTNLFKNCLFNLQLRYRWKRTTENRFISIKTTFKCK